MTLFLLIGLFCVLAVIGFFATGSPFKFAISGVVFLTAFVFVSLVVIVIWTMNAPCSAPFTDHNSVYCQNRAVSTPVSNSALSNISQQTPETSDSSGGSASPNEKCVTEDKDMKICDLSYSDSFYSSDFRNIFVEGNIVACVNMQTGEVSQGNAGRLRATTMPAFCTTDWGYVYIDPTLEVSKHYGAITREDYGKPYKIPQTYDTCIWTYNDGNGVIPYLEVLSNVGPRTGYNTRAFCVNGNNQVDIYSYKE